MLPLNVIPIIPLLYFSKLLLSVDDKNSFGMCNDVTEEATAPNTSVFSLYLIFETISLKLFFTDSVANNSVIEPFFLSIFWFLLPKSNLLILSVIRDSLSLTKMSTSLGSMSESIG